MGSLRQLFQPLRSKPSDIRYFRQTFDGHETESNTDNASVQFHTDIANITKDRCQRNTRHVVLHPLPKRLAPGTEYKEWETCSVA